jgi:hypothetical protein
MSDHDADPNDLYAVPESEQLDEDPAPDPDAEPEDLSDAPEGDDNIITWFGDDDLEVIGPEEE